MIKELSDIHGVGDIKLKQLKRLGVESLIDLVLLRPRRYEDYSHVTKLGSAQPGNITVKAQLETMTGGYRRRALHILQAVLRDDTGSLAVVWFNQPYLEKQLKIGEEYLFSGELQFSKGMYSLQNPRFISTGSQDAERGVIIPIYPETKGLTSRQIHNYVKQALKNLGPFTLLPSILEDHYNLPTLSEALTNLHQPQSQADITVAQKYFSMYELSAILIAAYKSKKEVNNQKAQSYEFDEALMKQFLATLPFKLTDDQRAVTWQVIKDIAKSEPMNRLVQGDVGSGKTVVAAAIMLQIAKQGGMAAIMAPTELLATQHAKTLTKLLNDFKLNVQLLTSATPNKDKERIKANIAGGKVDIVVGTHSLIQESLDFHNLQLAVIDEQHRFGVKQRHALQQKSKHLPHLLSMTATPIPRTLALTLYADLSISVIKQMPAGRKPVKTQLVGPGERATVHQHILKQLQAGRQAYVVYPLIEESEAIVALDAEAGYKQLSQAFKDYKVALLHGRLKSDEKDALMQQFVQGEIDILATTSVIEVGVDVSNASVLVIEGAERFGLAQAHQLRGRVGRSEHQSYCYLIPSHTSMISRRLRELAKSSDGFHLAEMDLEIRGPGAIYGTHQHGSLDVSFANLQDSQQIALAQSGAQLFIESGQDLLQYPQLAHIVKQYTTITQLN